MASGRTLGLTEGLLPRSAALDCVRGGAGDCSGMGSPLGEGTVGVAREGGGISVTDVSTAPKFKPLGAPPGRVTGPRASPGAEGRMLGGGGRRLVGLGCSAGTEGRMLGGGGRDNPRTGGGGGMPDGRESGAAPPPEGRGGSETGRGA